MRLAIALVSLGLSACITTQGDPLAPSASGTLSLADGVDYTQFHAIEIHFDRVDGTYGDDFTELREPPFAFPMEFDTGLGFGTSDARTYRLGVWFSNGTWDMPTATPPAGAAHATADIAIPDCTDGCSTVRGVALQLLP